jgi:hypothetical protein
MKGTGVHQEKKPKRTFFAVAWETTPLSALHAEGVPPEQFFSMVTMTVITAQRALQGGSAANVVKVIQKTCSFASMQILNAPRRARQPKEQPSIIYMDNYVGCKTIE